MIEVIRIIDEDKLYAYRATIGMQFAQHLDTLIGDTSSKNTIKNWHKFISASFIHPLPLNIARFRVSDGKNVFYGSLEEETALYEASFYIMKERAEIKSNKPGTRTIFWVDANEVLKNCVNDNGLEDRLKKSVSNSSNNNFVNLKNDKNLKELINKNNYAASLNFVIGNPNVTFILYPSCRDPKQRDNAAILDINHLARSPKLQKTINFFYDHKSNVLTWLDYNLQISWQEVAG